MRTVLVLFAVCAFASSAEAAPKKKPKKAVAAQPDTSVQRSVDVALESTLDSTSPPATPAPTPTPAPIAAAASASDSAPSSAAPAPEADAAAVDREARDTTTGFAVSVDAGLALMQQVFHSNGESRPGRLTDYDYAAQGVGARIALRHAWPVGPVLRLGMAGSYQYAGATSVNAPSYEAGRATSVSLSLESHHATAAFTAGAHANVLGGVLFEARAGSAMMLNAIGIDSRAPLPSDRTVGLLLGGRVAATSITRIGSKAVGLALDAAHVGLLAVHDQTRRLEDGDRASSSAWMFGGELSVSLLAPSSRMQLAAFVDAHAALQDTRYDGASVRNDPANGNTTSAEREQALYVSSLGLRLAY